MQNDTRGAVSLLSRTSTTSLQGDAAAIRQDRGIYELGLPTWVHFSVAPNSVGVHDVLKPLGELVGAD